MTTLISVSDISGNYSLSVKESFALDYGMLEDHLEFRYAFGTSDVNRTHCKNNIVNFVKNLNKSLLNRRRVNEVILSNELEFVKFINPILTFTIVDNNEYYIELSSSSIELGLVQTGNKHNIQYFNK